VYDNNYGIFLGQSPDNTLRDNALVNNMYNFGVVGLAVVDHHEDIDTTNTVNGKPIYYLVGNSYMLFDETTPVGYLGLISCDNIEVKNIVLTNNYHGILMVETKNSSVTNLTLYDNYYGAYMYLNSNNNSIMDSNIHDNFWVGIGLEYSHDNTIERTAISNNDYGVRLLVTVNNTVTNNDVQDNNYGIIVKSSTNITVYHNNLINNTIQAMDDEINNWNLPSPLGGNFWPSWYFPDDNCDGFVDFPKYIPMGETVIMITEIMWNPSMVIDTQGEWFEVYNAGTTTVDINGWEIKDTGTDSHIINNGGPLTIAPGEYLVLGINASFLENGGVEVDYEYSNFNLVNLVSDAIILMNGPVTIDIVEYDVGGIWPSPNGASIELLDYTKDNNNAAFWQATPSSKSYGDGDFGTPGEHNTGSIHSYDNLPYTNSKAWYTGWFNKSVYPNYAPMGVPDFDQRQKPVPFWMTINAGPNGNLDSLPVMGDDVLVNSTAGQNNVSIAPGPNHIIDTPLFGDDTLEYSYCGPTAAADGLWWLDSKFSDSSGFPGDMNDDHSLVEGYGALDDHARDNVPLLIEELAELFKTNETGTTNVSNMVDGLNQWLNIRGQQFNYTVYNESWPMWEKVAEEVRKCNIAILFLGFYDDEGTRVWGHIVTVSGVNQGGFLIGISDPIKNVANPIADFTVYNDPINVSHDIYIAMPGVPPISNPPPSWFWLEGYTSGYGFPMPPINYAIVEDVVIIAPFTPTVDYIDITYTPGGAPVIGSTVDVGFTEWGYCSLYNNTIGYFGTAIANWTAQGGTASLLGPTPDEINGIDVGSEGGIVWLNVSYDIFSETVQYTVNPPTVNYIEITDIPGGTPLSGGDVGVGFKEWGNCSRYNNTIGFIDTISANWTATGGTSSLLASTQGILNGIDVGVTEGFVWFNVSIAGFNDSVMYNVSAVTIDYIEIVDILSWAPLSGGSVPVGFTEWAKCSAYNNSIGFLYNVSADWLVEGGSAFLLNVTPGLSNGINVNMTGGTVWLNASYMGKVDSVQYDVIPPTVDYVEITDTPGGTPLAGGIVLFDTIEWGNFSVYNNTAGFIFTIAANWTAQGGNSVLLGPTPSDGNGINVSDVSGPVWFNASYFDGVTWFNISVVYFPAPDVDYINITDIPNGTPLFGGNVSVGFTQWGFASAYNNIDGYLGTVSADWSVEGGTAFLLNGTTTIHNGINVGSTSGFVWLNATYNGHIYSIMYNVSEPTIDYIEITDGPGGPALAGGIVPVGFTQWGNASAFNNSIGFIWEVDADWMVEGGAPTLLDPSPSASNGINVGNTPGLVWLNASYGIHNFSVEYNVSEPTIDYIEITDVPGGFALIGGPVLKNHIIWGNASAFNTTSGYIKLVSADWTAEGGNSNLLGSTPFEGNGIDCGNISETVWLNASYMGHEYSIEFLVGVLVVDYILITDTPNGTVLAGGVVLPGFVEWGNCSMYNNTEGYIDTVVANWTVEGAGATLLGPTPSLTNGIDVGNTSGTIWFNVSYSSHSASVIYYLRKPAKPTDITAESGESYIHISWSPPVSNGSSPITNYTIYRHTDPGMFVKIAEVGNILYYNDTSVINGDTYYYVISANNSLGEGPQSAEVVRTAGALPSAPLNFQVVAGDSYVDLTWNPPTSDGGLVVTQYQVYRGPNPSQMSQHVLLGDVLSYRDETAKNGVTYNYEIRAINDLGEGSPSSTEEAVPKGVPDSPTTLIATAGDEVVHLSWGAPLNEGGSPIVHYRVYRGESSGGEVLLIEVGIVTSYTDNDVVNNVTYFYWVSAVNDGVGEGAHSNEVNAIPMVPPVPENKIPTAQITSPLTEDIVNGTVTISGTVSDVDGTIQFIQIKIGEDGQWINISGNESFSHDLDTTTLDNGRHPIYVRAYDGENYSKEAGITIIVNNPKVGPGEGEDNTALILGIIVAIIIIILILFFIATRRKRWGRDEDEYEEEEEEEEEEEDEEEEEEEDEEEVDEDLLEDEEEEPEEEETEDEEEEEESEEEEVGEEVGEEEESEEEEPEEEEEELLEEEEEPEEEEPKEDEPKEAGEAEEKPVEEIPKKEAQINIIGKEVVLPSKEFMNELTVFECPECASEISSSDFSCPECGVEFEK
jgi:parallel beta-helix repeat protein